MNAATIAHGKSGAKFPNVLLMYPVTSTSSRYSRLSNTTQLNVSRMTKRVAAVSIPRTAVTAGDPFVFSISQFACLSSTL
jgi:hypothetical protein